MFSKLVGSYWGLLLILLVAAGSVLLGHLGAGTVPERLKPISDRWVRTGRDPRWVALCLWLIFSSIAFIFFISVLIPLGHAALYLGRGLK